MKLRIFQDSIRFRVQVPEIEELLSNKVIKAFVSLGSIREAGIHYHVTLSKVAEPTIDFQHNIVNLLIPEEMGLKWCNGNDVGIYGSQQVHDGKMLKILLEKDFKCLDDTFEDQSDMFPNPKETC